MSIIKPGVLVGSDPEVFLYDTHQKKFVSAIDKVGGSKYSPMPLDKEGFFVQEDNVLAEFNIPPAASENEFVTNITLGLELLKKRLPYPGLELRAQGSAFLPEDELQDARAHVFGCDPDFNAWKNGKINAPPCADNAVLRSAGGHVLVGYKLQDEEVSKAAVDMNIIRWMDFFLGVPSVLMDKDKDRKKLYGKAGCFRHKDFGVEYRTLSSFWLGSQKLISWAYRGTMKAVERAAESKFIDPQLAKRIVRAIDYSDESIAKDLVSKYQLEVVG